MDSKAGFQRVFMFFENEDPGYEAGQKPSGYIKLEAREGRGKLSALAQNLKDQGDRLTYRLYLIQCGKRQVLPVPVGALKFRQGKGELEWEFNPSNVSGTGLGIKDFNMAAVLVEHKDRVSAAVICPLAAYRDEKGDWRGRVAELLYSGGKKPVKPAEELISKFPAGLSSMYQPVENNPEFNMPVSAIEKFTIPVHYEDNYQPEMEVETDQENNAPAEGFLQDNPYIPEEGPWNDNQPQPWTPFQGNPFQGMPLQGNPMQGVPLQGNPMQGIPFQGMPVQGIPAQGMPIQGIPQQNAPQQNMPYQNMPYQNMQHPDTTPVQSIPFQPQGIPSNVNTNCLYMNSNMCGMYLNNGVNPCANCQVHATGRKAPDQAEKQGDIERLKQELDSQFEVWDPFHSRRSDYKWWKVTNPVNLNNTLYQCNIQSPLLFNPTVMMAHFRYKHLIIGIFTDRVRRREYVVCGVPGRHMVDRVPFGELCRWVQVEGGRPRSGVFGYWLVYIDPKSGKILNLK